MEHHRLQFVWIVMIHVRKALDVVLKIVLMVHHLHFLPVIGLIVMVFHMIIQFDTCQ